MARWELTPHGVIVDEETFAFVTELQSRQAARLNYPLSLLTIRPAFPDSDDAITTPGIGHQLGEIISAKVRGTDLVEVPSTPSGHLRVCLVGADLEDLPTVIGRLVGEIHDHTFEVNGRREAVKCSVGGSSLPATAERPSDLMIEADSLAIEAHREGTTYRLPNRNR